MPSSAAGCRTGAPSNTMPSISDPYRSHASCSRQTAAIASHSPADSTAPAGNDGFITNTARVRGAGGGAQRLEVEPPAAAATRIGTSRGARRRVARG